MNLPSPTPTSQHPRYGQHSALLKVHWFECKSHPNALRGTSRLTFHQISGHHSPAKLTNKINHYRDIRRQAEIVIDTILVAGNTVYIMVYSLSPGTRHLGLKPNFAFSSSWDLRQITQWFSEWSRSVVSDSLWPHGLWPTMLLHPWDFPGKSTGVGCHFLLQGIFPTQGSNLGLPHCRQMLYHLRHQGSASSLKWVQNNPPLLIVKTRSGNKYQGIKKPIEHGEGSINIYSYV